MPVVTGVLLVLHLLGAAAIIGPWLAAPREGRIRAAMVWGARAQILTGLLLVAVHEMGGDPGEELNNAKVAVKLVVALACVACAEVANGRQRRAAGGAAGRTAGEAAARVAGPEAGERAGGAATVAPPSPGLLPARGLVHAAALLAVLNVAIAVLWQ